jgi:ribosomal protein S27E
MGYANHHPLQTLTLKTKGLTPTKTINRKDMKYWKHFTNGGCPNCGNDVRVFTEAEQDGWAFEDDEVKCVECGEKGSIVIVGDGEACVNWNNEDYD